MSQAFETILKNVKIKDPILKERIARVLAEKKGVQVPDSPPLTPEPNVVILKPKEVEPKKEEIIKPKEVEPILPKKVLPASNELLVVKKDDQEWKFYVQLAQAYAQTCEKCFIKKVDADQQMPENCDECEDEQMVFAVDYTYFKKRITESDFLVFGSKNKKRVCIELDQRFAQSLMRWKKNNFIDFAQECLEPDILSTVDLQSMKISDIIQLINENLKSLSQIVDLMQGVIIGKFEGDTVYIDIVCAKKGGTILIQRFLEWCKINGYQSIKLYALPYVINYYKHKFKFDFKGQNVPVNPKPKAKFCYGWARIDQEFGEYLKQLTDLGFAHACKTQQKKDEVRKSCQSKGNLKRFSTIDECFYASCADNGYEMHLDLNDMNGGNKDIKEYAKSIGWCDIEPSDCEF